MKNEYYLLEDTQRNGPFTYNEVLRKGLDVHTQVATSAMGEWQYASELPEFYPYFESKGVYFPTGDNLASFGWRALAFIIDIIVLIIPIDIFVFNTGLVKIPDTLSLTLPSREEALMIQGIFAAAFLIYNTALEATPLKGSLGKKLCKIIVVDIDGQRLSVAKVFARNAGAFLSMTLFWGLSFISMLFNEHKQTWYDRLTRAYTIKIDS